MDVFITHISTACVLIEIGSVRILTDPVFDSGERYYSFGLPFVGATRFLDATLRPEEIPELDAILLSHPHHPDNLDDGGRALFPKAREIITNRHGQKHLKGHATGLCDWGETTIFGRGGERITVTATPALHGPRWLYQTRHVCGFVLRWKDENERTIYISGDTVYFDELERITDEFRIDVALLHLGAVDFWPPVPPWVRFTFNSEEAVKLARRLNPKAIIPIHYEQSVWSHFKEDVASYQRAFKNAGIFDKVRWLARGEKTVITI
jgi:L-ascorbate metabolism protein UlaG (beta-lactamase superfamily)